MSTIKSPKRKYQDRSRGVSNLHGHLIIATKYRRDVMTEPMLVRLGELVAASCEKWQCDLIESNGSIDAVANVKLETLKKYVQSQPTETRRFPRVC